MVEEFKQVITASSTRKRERAERTQTEDFDAEEGELLEEENEQEEEVFDQVRTSFPVEPNMTKHILPCWFGSHQISEVVMTKHRSNFLKTTIEGPVTSFLNVSVYCTNSGYVRVWNASLQYVHWAWVFLECLLHAHGIWVTNLHLLHWHVLCNVPNYGSVLLFHQVGECLGTLIKTFKVAFLPYFEELISYITPMLVSNTFPCIHGSVKLYWL